MPEEIEAESLVLLYPALEPDKGKVNIKLYQDKELAHETHKIGVQELLTFRLAKDVKFMKREWPFPGDASKASIYFGGESALCDLMYKTLLKNLFRKNIRSGEEFESYSKELAGLMFEKFRELREITLKVVLAYGRTRSFIEDLERSKRITPAGMALCAEARQYAEKLVPGDFLDIYKQEEILELPRYLRALEVRAERGINNPEKDAEKSKQVEYFERAFKNMLEGLSSHASVEKKQGIEHFRSMIEEYRVSIFAPELGTAFPVSSKRLKKHVERLERLV